MDRAWQALTASSFYSQITSKNGMIVVVLIMPVIFLDVDAFDVFVAASRIIVFIIMKLRM